MRIKLTTTIVVLLTSLVTACGDASSESEPTTSDEPIVVPSSTQAVSTTIPMSTAEFFSGVLHQLGIQNTEFALNALDAWARMENTRAEWNPLATTMRKPGSLDFNSAGVQNYPDRDTGIDATAVTLALPYYEPIRAMLRQESFEREQIHSALTTWSGNGGYVPRLVDD